MSAVVFYRIGFETETTQVTPVSTPRPRVEEFRAALDHYMAAYIACQKRRTKARNAASVGGRRDRSFACHLRSNGHQD
ncbi:MULTISPECIES: hypothetical protein [unclassified Mesorhizobium]|uniref:hypothetical protein n=1 Tax=unclassified Mesorhizobium TaxID=325217 RepID=UPI001126F8F4|nr:MULTISPECIES: hypothetical protein [unclassified Mesorhizobium]TPJ37204.1 hypothetical protein FJ418_02890 [Mesorhizobium sp. B2-8-3]UCI28027.1 hypothetical protein FJ430_10660 [Mesorhizobium sp. B2-8-5]